MNKTYDSLELYNYYKHWVNDGLRIYRMTEDSPKREEWLRFVHRAACLTDLWLRVSKQCSRRI